MVASLSGVALDVRWWSWVNGLHCCWGWHGRDDWQWGRSGGDCNWGWSGHGNWCWCWEWCWSCVGNRGGNVHWCVVSNLRLECVTIDIGGSADNLVADVLVANDGVSGLDCLQNSGWMGDGVHAWRLWNQSLAVDCGDSGHGCDGWDRGDSWSCSVSCWAGGDRWRQWCFGRFFGD